MNDQLQVERVPLEVWVVGPYMGTIARGIETPQTAFDAAQRAFEDSYYTGGDELHAALARSTPLIRLDEVSGVMEALRHEVDRVPNGPDQESVRAGLRLALALLETRSRDLGTAA